MSCDEARILRVLQHALGRDEYGVSRSRYERPGEDYRNHYCAGPDHADFETCREAVAQDLMKEHPPSDLSGGDHVFTVTEQGKAYIAANSPKPPNLTRGQRRYREWLSGAADCGIAFGDWLRTRQCEPRLRDEAGLRREE